RGAGGDICGGRRRRLSAGGAPGGVRPVGESLAPPDRPGRGEAERRAGPLVRGGRGDPRRRRRPGGQAPVRPLSFRLTAGPTVATIPRLPKLAALESPCKRPQRSASESNRNPFVPRFRGLRRESGPFLRSG